MKRGIPIAAKLYRDPQRAKWVKRVRSDYKDELLVAADLISEYYGIIIRALTPNQRKVIVAILSSYSRGISVKEIAKKCLMKHTTVSSYLTLMRGASLVDSRVNPKNRRERIYHVPDKNWLRSYAIKSDVRFLKWRERNEKHYPNDVVDQFILWASYTGGK